MQIRLLLVAATAALSSPFWAPSLTAQTAEPIAAPLPPLVPWQGASETLPVPAGHLWITPSEVSGLTASPSYADTIAFVQKMAAASPLLRLEIFGRTPQGRDMVAVVARKPAATPKPVVLVQAGIHSGEIDGKDAGLMLLRDIAFRGKDSLLDKVDLVFVPIFNIDGHERASRFNRPNQRGPLLQGWRTTSQNYNLNREYLKADAPEMQAMLGLIRKYNPVLYLDLHVTDGTDHQYDVAFSFSGWDGLYAKSPAIGRWLDQKFRPSISAALSNAGHTPGYYVSAVDNRDPLKGITLDPDTPRFSTGYGDHARIPTVLVETHSLKPYRQRVLGTYILFEQALMLAAADAPALSAAIAQDRKDRPETIILSWKPLDKPLKTIPFKGIAHEIYRSSISGRDEIRWLGKPVDQMMPVFGVKPDRINRLPVAWWVPASAPDVIARLKLHGVEMETIDIPRTIKLDMVRLTDPKLDGAAEGRVRLSAADYRHEMREEIMPAGSVRVPATQPLGLIAAVLLEAESDDGFLAWNFFPGMLQRTEYIEGYAVEPMAAAMLARDPALRTAFEQRLAGDKNFAADPEERLRWFYERSPYYDQRYLLYPIGREISP